METERPAPENEGAPTTRTTDIAIVGGGICGLTSALALEQHGLDPVVYEGATEYRPVGAGLLLQTNALRVLGRLGVADRVREAGVPLSDTLLRGPSGAVLKRFDLDRVECPEFGYGFVAIHRADLQGILLDELDADVETDKECVSVTGTESPTVEFADGTRLEPDVLVGTDGIHSAVRDAVAPDVTPRALDSCVYRAVVETDLSERDQTRGFEVWGDGAYTGGAPLDSDRFYWFATVPEPDVDAAESRVTTAALRERFGDFPEPVPSVVDALSPEDVFVTPLEDLPSLPRWHDGSVVLAGDAAHGMLPFAGQGAAQAIEDALWLAHCIESWDSTQSAFEAYQAERRPRADRIRAESRRLGALGTMQSRLGARLRNGTLSLLPNAIFRRLRRRRAADASIPVLRT